MLTQIDAMYGMEANAPAWSEYVVYYANEQVTHQGITYIAVRANSGVTPGPGAQQDWLPSRKALELPIIGANTKNSLLVRTVNGLGPPDVNLFIGEYSRDGGSYQGRRVGERNVVMTIDLNPNPALGETVSGLRDLLYKVFIDPLVNAEYVELVLHDSSGKLRNVAGYTEKLETDIFSSETTAQISMLCPDPYIRDSEITNLTNDTGTWVAVPFLYDGTAETGFEIEANISEATSVLTLNNNGQSMVFNHNFVPGDVVYINTNRGTREVRKASLSDVLAAKDANPAFDLGRLWSKLVTDGLTMPLVGTVYPGSRWLELHSQANTMFLHGAFRSEVVAGIKTLEYRASYWGV